MLREVPYAIARASTVHDKTVGLFQADVHYIHMKRLVGSKRLHVSNGI